MLICGQGLDIVQKFSASQIIKQDGILPKNPSKKDAMDKLKVRKKITQSFTEEKKGIGFFTGKINSP